MYYRIAQVDYDGRTSKSKIAGLNFTSRQSEIRVFPTVLSGSGS